MFEIPIGILENKKKQDDKVKFLPFFILDRYRPIYRPRSDILAGTGIKNTGRDNIGLN